MRSQTWALGEIGRRRRLSQHSASDACECDGGPDPVRPWAFELARPRRHHRDVDGCQRYVLPSRARPVGDATRISSVCRVESKIVNEASVANDPNKDKVEGEIRLQSE